MDDKELVNDIFISINLVRFTWTKPQHLGINISFNLIDNANHDNDIFVNGFLDHFNNPYPWVVKNPWRNKVSYLNQNTEPKEGKVRISVDLY